MFNAEDDDHIVSQRERLRIVRGIHQIDCLVAVFEQEVQLLKNLGKVPALDLVDDQHEAMHNKGTAAVDTAGSIRAGLTGQIMAGPQRRQKMRHCFPFQSKRSWCHWHAREPSRSKASLNIDGRRRFV